MASHSLSYSSCRGRSREALGSEIAGIESTCRKSRFGRHLSRARKLVFVFVMLEGCEIGWFVDSGRGGGLAKEAGSWARRSSGTVDVGLVLSSWVEDVIGTRAPSSPWPGATGAVDGSASSSSSRSISSALTGRVVLASLAFGAGSGSSSSMSRSISSVFFVG